MDLEFVRGVLYACEYGLVTYCTLELVVKLVLQHSLILGSAAVR